MTSDPDRQYLMIWETQHSALFNTSLFVLKPAQHITGTLYIHREGAVLPDG